MDSEVADRLARRYPAKRSLIDWRVLAVLGGVLALGWTAWVALDGATPPVAARVDAFQVISDTEVRVTLTIERENPERPAGCLLFVQAVSYERVGELRVELPPDGQAVSRQEVSVRTFKRGTSAALEGCRATG